MLCSEYTMIRDTPSTYRLDYQPLFGKGAHAPPPNSPRGGAQARHERAAEIEPRCYIYVINCSRG